MKSNIQLQHDVVAELQWEPRIDDKHVTVDAVDGVVTLSGSVPSFAQKWDAERAAERVAGVRSVANELTVNPTPNAVHSDTQLAHAVTDALAWDIQVPDDKIQSAVSNGWVRLQGTVEWAYQRDAALRAVRNLAGVRGVTSDIVVKPVPVSMYDVSKEIKDALERRADRTAEKITVEAHDGVVTLRGTVTSFADRRAAEGAAWSARGVKDVKDEIAVLI
jgi:osmotically-inducible protein OsmY